MPLSKRNEDTFPQVVDGETVDLAWKKDYLKLACCDCSLVHDIVFNVKGPKLLMTTWRNKKDTAKLRRRKKKTNR